jgi:hypothetical protein
MHVRTLLVQPIPPAPLAPPAQLPPPNPDPVRPSMYLLPAPPPPSLPSRYVVPIVWIPVMLALLWRAQTSPGPLSITLSIPLFAIGIIAWQLIEYSLHRWVFHMKPTGPAGIVFHFLMHG